MGEKGASPIAKLLIFTILILSFLAGGYYVLAKTKYAESMTKIPVIGKYLQLDKDKKNKEQAKAAQLLSHEGRLKIQERELEKQTKALEEQEVLLREREEKIAKQEAQPNGDLSRNKLQDQQIKEGMTPDSNTQFKRLAKIYTGMEAKKAAEIMKNLDDNSIIVILSQMKADQAAEVIGALEPQKAAKITKLMMQATAQ